MVGWLAIAGLGALVLEAKVREEKILSALSVPPPRKVLGPLISVAIPSLEEQKYLPNLLTSLRNQTYNNLEIVICDQSGPLSKERTKEIARLFGATVIDQEVPHVAQARNAAARASVGPIILFTDADVIYPHTYIEQIASTLGKGYASVRGKAVFYDNLVLSALYIPIQEFSSGIRITQSVGVWRTVWESVGGYDETTKAIGESEDIRFGKAIARKFGPEKMALIDEVYGTSARRLIKEGLLPTWETPAIRWFSV